MPKLYDVPEYTVTRDKQIGLYVVHYNNKHHIIHTKMYGSKKLYAASAGGVWRRTLRDAIFAVLLEVE
ncbi:MAG: hypothetical protein ACRDCE_20430 [Cetobacterium sp.]|uniref:hypothetical protein n=1 Tax=Cetobacterium sp. TaxID=2071632 RepID=UPI003EE75F34